MKLFIWDNPYDVAYGHAMAFCMAESLEQAKELMKTAVVGDYGLTVRYPTQIETRDLSQYEPSRIIDVPHGEAWEWSE